uniref:PAZ domain-containing protein n=1 Tax=Globodera pallida TaxID=36090 RepID=A0A183CC83_GLOPA
MPNLLAVLAEHVKIPPHLLTRAVRGAPGKMTEVEEKLEEIYRSGAILRTTHLRPEERNQVLQGGTITAISACQIRAYDGVGPTVAQYYREKHGVRLQYEGAPCLEEPGRRGHVSHFPLELIQVVPRAEHQASVPTEEPAEANSAGAPDGVGAPQWWLDPPEQHGDGSPAERPKNSGEPGMGTAESRRRRRSSASSPRDGPS